MKASIFQRKSDMRWVGVIEMDREKGEKRNRPTVYGHTEKEVEDKVNLILYEIQTNQYIKPDKNSVMVFLREYYDICLNTWEDTTAQLYKLYIDVHFEPYFKDIKLSDVIPVTLDKFYNKKMTETRTHDIKQKDGTIKKKIEPPLSNNTVIKFNKFLGAAFNYAVINNKMRKNPTIGVKLSPKKDYEPTVYNVQQFSDLLSLVRGTVEEIPIVLGGGCGLRRGEMCGLKWEDVNYETGMMRIKKTKARFSTDIVKGTKNKSSERNLCAPPYVVAVLKSYYESIGSPAVDEYILTRWNPQSLSKWFNNLLEKHNLTHIRLHDLRHYNAVIMMNCNIQDKVAAERLGHSNVTTLRKIYQHVLKDIDEDAADKINNAFEIKVKPEPEQKPEPEPEVILSREDIKSTFTIVRKLG